MEELRKMIESKSAKRVRLNVQEIRQPELDAYLVARNVADQLERADSVQESRQAGHNADDAGWRSGREGHMRGTARRRRDSPPGKAMEGRVPLHTLRADIDFAVTEAAPTSERIGVKAWIYRGDILPAPKEQEDDMAPIEVTVTAEREATTDATTQESKIPGISTGAGARRSPRRQHCEFRGHRTQGDRSLLG